MNGLLPSLKTCTNIPNSLYIWKKKLLEYALVIFFNRQENNRREGNNATFLKIYYNHKIVKNYIDEESESALFIL